MSSRPLCSDCGEYGHRCRCDLIKNNIRHISDNKPHLTVNCGESVHVIPVALIEDVIEGKKDFTQLDQWDVLLKTILKDWLDSVRA